MLCPCILIFFLSGREAYTYCIRALAYLTGRKIPLFILYFFLSFAPRHNHQNPLKWEFPTLHLRFPKKSNKVPNLFLSPRRYEIVRFRILFQIIFLKGSGFPGTHLPNNNFRKNVCSFRIPYGIPKLFSFRKPPFSLVSLHNQIY